MSITIYTHGALEAWDAFYRDACSELWVIAWNNLIHSYHAWMQAWGEYDVK